MYTSLRNPLEEKIFICKQQPFWVKPSVHQIFAKLLSWACKVLIYKIYIIYVYIYKPIYLLKFILNLAVLTMHKTFFLIVPLHKLSIILCIHMSCPLFIFYPETTSSKTKLLSFNKIQFSIPHTFFCWKHTSCLPIVSWNISFVISSSFNNIFNLEFSTLKNLNF